jgi:hypothetical protein
MGEIRNAYRILIRKPEGKRPLEDTGVRGRIILKWISKEQGMRTWTGVLWLSIEKNRWLL